MDTSISLDTIVQIASFVFLAGGGWIKIRVLERDYTELKEEIRDFRGLREDMAVMKSQLASINECLHKLMEGKII